MTEKITNPELKTWWTKRLLSDNYHCAGRLSERQLKLAADGEFATIVSLFTYPDETNRAKLYDSRFDLPSTSQTSDALSMCEDVHFEAILERGVDWRTESTVFKVKELVESCQKPILLYCDNSYASAFLLLAYYAYVTSRRENDEPAVSDRDVFRIGALLGYDFGGDPVLVDLVSKLTGNPRLSRTPYPEIAVSNWYDLYWIMKPVYKEFFICGQFQSNHLQRIAKVGFKLLINCRTGKPKPEENQKPEEVALLNISGRVDTKGDLTNFLPKRVSKERPKTFIAKGSPFNFEFINPLEFGDVDGYDIETERRHVTKFLFSTLYTNIPFSSKAPFTLKTWEQYVDFIKNYPDITPIMIHCKTGSRAGQLGILAAAYKYGFSSKWASDRAAILGYVFDEDDFDKIIEEVLD